MLTRNDPIDLIDPNRRRLHPGRQLLSMFTDIVAGASFIVGMFWGTFMTTWAPVDRHVEMIAQTAESLAFAACLWAISARLYPSPWFSKPRQGSGQ